MENSGGFDASVPVVADASSGFLIPCEPQEFGDFLSGLLKTQKTVRYLSARPFYIEFEDIADFSRIIHARISEQQRYSLVSEEFAAFYSDGVSWQCGSLQEFSSHSPMSDCSCEKVTASWVYLIEFPGSEVPKKQEIFLSFSKLSSSKKKQEFAREVFYRDASPRLIVSDSAAEISIRHTHVTFGNDLINLLSERLKRSERSRERSSFFNGGIVTFGWFATFIFCGVAVAGLLAGAVSRSIFEGVGSLLDAFLNGWLAMNIVLSLGLTLLFVVLSSIIGLYLYDKLRQEPVSYIVLNDRQKKLFDDEESQNKKGWVLDVLGFFAALAVGVFSSLIATGVLQLGFVKDLIGLIG